MLIKLSRQWPFVKMISEEKLRADALRWKRVARDQRQVASDLRIHNKANAARLKSKLAWAKRSCAIKKAPRDALRAHWADLVKERRRGAVIPPDPGFPVVRGNVEGLELLIPAAELDSSLERRIRDRQRLVFSEFLLRRLFARGSGAYVDIGANVGLTCLPHAVLGDFALIIAVEPEERNFECLRFNVSANGLAEEVTCVRLAVGAEPGEAAIRLTERPGTHFISSDVAGGVAGVSQTVERVRLDDLLEEVLPPRMEVSLVKCDTQGFEGHILRGATETLAKRAAAWQIEFWPRGLERAGSSVDVVRRTLEGSFRSFIDFSDRVVELRQVAELSAVADRLGPDGCTDLLLLP